MTQVMAFENCPECRSTTAQNSANRFAASRHRMSSRARRGGAPRRDTPGMSAWEVARHFF
jgi:hypothetical protein